MIPIIVIVMILNCTLITLDGTTLLKFGIGAVLVIIGLTLFLIGVDIGISPLGGHVGVSLAKTNNLFRVIVWGFILGFFISIAEPGLMVLAGQVDKLTSGMVSYIMIVVSVSAGLAIMLAMGFLRIVYNIPLYIIIVVLYGITFFLLIFTSEEFFAISFDASGSTTGVMAVPFILSLSVGISAIKKDSKASEKDSFGLVAIASVGAILSVIILSLLINISNYNTGSSVDNVVNRGVVKAFVYNFADEIQEVIISIIPIIIIFMIFHKFYFDLKKHHIKKIRIGFVYTFLGLLIFLTGVNTGFMDVGNIIGGDLVKRDSSFFVIIVGFILGVVTIIAEPAVYVLTYQIENVTSGYVKRKAVLIALAIGVGIAIGLSVFRIITPEINLYHIIIPGYMISLILSFFVPKLFVGIAFDAGGVATGPITATFIMAFIQGVAGSFQGADLIRDGLGMIATVAMTPIITIQILGLIFKIKSGKRGKEIDS